MMLLPVWFPGPMFLLGGSLSGEWGLSPRESLSRGKEGLWGGVSVRVPPSYGEERAVRILLECFPVVNIFSLVLPIKIPLQASNYIIYCDLDDDDFEAEIPKKGAATDKWEGEDEDDDVKVWKARESS